MLDRLPSELLGRVLAELDDPAKRRQAAEALSQVCCGLREVFLPCLGATLLEEGLHVVGLQAVPAADAQMLIAVLLASWAAAEPVAIERALLAPPAAAPGALYAWMGQVWLSGAGAATAAGRDCWMLGSVLLVARHKAGLVLASPRSCMGAFGEFAAEAQGSDLRVLLPAPGWIVQSWAHLSPGRRTTPLKLARAYATQAAAKRAVQSLFEAQQLWAELKEDPYSVAYAEAWALAARHPRVLCQWDWESLKVGLDNSGRKRCLHFGLAEGGYSSNPAVGFAGLDSCLGMTAENAAAEWDKEAEFEERLRCEKRTRWR